jgi:hypothetical protein
MKRELRNITRKSMTKMVWLNAGFLFVCLILCAIDSYLGSTVKFVASIPSEIVLAGLTFLSVTNYFWFSNQLEKPEILVEQRDNDV